MDNAFDRLMQMLEAPDVDDENSTDFEDDLNATESYSDTDEYYNDDTLAEIMDTMDLDEATEEFMNLGSENGEFILDELLPSHVMEDAEDIIAIENFFNYVDTIIECDEDTEEYMAAEEGLFSSIRERRQEKKEAKQRIKTEIKKSQEEHGEIERNRLVPDLNKKITKLQSYESTLSKLIEKIKKKLQTDGRNEKWKDNVLMRHQQNAAKTGQAISNLNKIKRRVQAMDDKVKNGKSYKANTIHAMMKKADTIYEKARKRVVESIHAIQATGDKAYNREYLSEKLSRKKKQIGAKVNDVKTTVQNAGNVVKTAGKNVSRSVAAVKQVFHEGNKEGRIERTSRRTQANIRSAEANKKENSRRRSVNDVDTEVSTSRNRWKEKESGATASSAYDYYDGEDEIGFDDIEFVVDNDIASEALSVIGGDEEYLDEDENIENAYDSMIDSLLSDDTPAPEVDERDVLTNGLESIILCDVLHETCTAEEYRSFLSENATELELYGLIDREAMATESYGEADETEDSATEARNVVKLNRDAVISREEARIAIGLAKQANDPLYKYYHKYAVLKRKFRDKIYAKYGTKARPIARKAVMNSRNKASAMNSKTGTTVINKIDQRIMRLDKNGRNGQAIKKKTV